MKFPAHAQKRVLMFLGTLAVVSLIFTTWAVGRISAEIVYHNSEAYQLTSRVDFFLAEAFFVFQNYSWLLMLEFLFGVCFLWLLWRRFYRPD
jgi:hypothetical protein